MPAGGSRGARPGRRRSGLTTARRPADPRWAEHGGGAGVPLHARARRSGTAPVAYADHRIDNLEQVSSDLDALLLVFTRIEEHADGAGERRVEWVQRDRPIVKLHYVFNVEQTEGLKLRSLAEAAPEWEGHERAEALIKSSGVRLDHVAGDRAYRGR